MEAGCVKQIILKFASGIWNKIPKDLIKKAFLKEISGLSEKNLDGVPTSSSMSFNDNDSSDIHEILPLDHIEMFHTDTEDKDSDFLI